MGLFKRKTQKELEANAKAVESRAVTEEQRAGAYERISAAKSRVRKSKYGKVIKHKKSAGSGLKAFGQGAARVGDAQMANFYNTRQKTVTSRRKVRKKIKKRSKVVKKKIRRAIRTAAPFNPAAITMPY